MPICRNLENGCLFYDRVFEAQKIYLSVFQGGESIFVMGPAHSAKVITLPTSEGDISRAAAGDDIYEASMPCFQV